MLGCAVEFWELKSTKLGKTAQGTVFRALNFGEKFQVDFPSVVVALNSLLLSSITHGYATKL